MSGFRTRDNPSVLRNKVGISLADDEFDAVEKIAWNERRSPAGMCRVLLLEALATRGVVVEANQPAPTSPPHGRKSKR